MKKQKYNWLILLIGLIAFYFVNGDYNITIAAWIYTTAILLFFRKSEKKWMKFILFILIVIISIFKWYGFMNGGTIENILASAGLGAIFFLPFLIDSNFYQKNSKKKLLIFPFSFATIEFIMSLTPIGTLDSLAVTQTDNLALSQIASIGGPYLISVIVALFASIFVYELEKIKETKPDHKPAIIYLIVLISIHFLGGVRLVLSNNNYKNIKIAVSTGIYNGDASSNFMTLKVEQSIESMKKSVTDAAKSKAEIIAFNEEAFTLKDNDLNKMYEEIKKSAKENNIYILIPLEVEDTDDSEGGKTENGLYLFDNNGNEVFKYIKTKLVVGYETSTYIKGNGTVPNKTIELPSGQKLKLSSLICMDANYPDFVRNKIDKDTELVIIPSWDWKEIDDFHNRWILLRSIENGFTTIRATYDGYSACIDPFGKITSITHTNNTGFENAVVYDSLIKNTPTFYSYFGFIIDWLYPLTLIISILPLKKRK